MAIHHSIISSALVAFVIAILVCTLATINSDAPNSHAHQANRLTSLATPPGHNVRAMLYARASAVPYDTRTPPENSLFWTLWANNKALAHRALHSRYIVAVRTGTLAPATYRRWSLSDAFYCAESTISYELAARRARGTWLAPFLLQKAQWNREYNKFFERSLNISAAGVPASVASPVIRAYAQFERHVATSMHPVYTLVVMMPCEWLWPWVTSELGRLSHDNAYADWATFNLDAKPAFVLGNALHTYMERHPGVVDLDVAEGLYRRSMLYEVENFNDM